MNIGEMITEAALNSKPLTPTKKVPAVLRKQARIRATVKPLPDIDEDTKKQDQS